MLSIAPSTSILWAVGAVFLAGAMQPITNGPIMAVMQSTVEPDMQARVFSLLSSMAAGMSPVGLLIAGPISDNVGIQAWFLVGGIVCILMAVAGMFIPAVLNIEDRNPVTADVQEELIPDVSMGD